jgi:hypothetical protein
MTMENVKNKREAGDCPSFEHVSAYSDGELASGTPEHEHIGKCPDCQSRLAAYEAIGAKLLDELGAMVPKGLVDGVMLEIDRGKRRSAGSSVRPFRAFAKVAALFIVSAAVFVVLLPKRGGGKSAERSSTASSPAVPPRPLAFLGDATPSASPGAGVGGSKHGTGTVTGGNVDYSDFTPVDSSGTKTRPCFAGVSRDDVSETSVRIPSRVRQTWCVANISKAAKIFAGFAENAGVEVRRVSDADGNLILSCDITKKKLAELARELHSEGCKLLSPVQPQPEQTLFSGKSGDIVSYRAAFVETR